MRCINSLIRPTFFLYSQNQKAFTSPFPSWDLQRVEPGDNQSETAICRSRYLSMSFFFLFFSAVFPFFFSSCIFVGTWNLQIIQVEERIFRKKLGDGLAKPRRASLLGEAFGRRCRCRCLGHRWCSLNRWKDAEDFGLAISSSTYLLILIHRSPCRNWWTSPNLTTCCQNTSKLSRRSTDAWFRRVPVTPVREQQDWIPWWVSVEHLGFRDDFNPSEKYSSNWIISPCLKPPSRLPILKGYTIR